LLLIKERPNVWSIQEFGMHCTNNEQKYASDVRLISTTNLKGEITYANPEFCKIAGYSLDELIGQPHNIVRHPGMPSAAFNDLWSHASSNKPWVGLVKNRCKNGDYYWVQAYVTPLFDREGVKVGYQSVRTKPTDEQVARAESTYAKLSRKSVSIKPKSLVKKVTSFSILFCVAIVAVTFSPLGEAVKGLVVTGCCLLMLLSNYYLIKPLNRIRQYSQEVYDNSLAQYAMTSGMNEVGSAELANFMMQSRLRAVIGRVEDSIDMLSHFMTETQHSIVKTSQGITQQNLESDMLASAATEMSATAHEIAENTAQTSEATQSTAQLANTGKVIVADMIDGIKDLVGEVENASHSSEVLKEKAAEVEQVVNIINSIAEQTNLLALNAAIEAARAGDQGRGFSVVADEVRVLAQRTQESTGEIRATIDSIQQQVSSTVDVMTRCNQYAHSNIERAENAGRSFDDVNGAMVNITDRSTQVAAASEEQSAVAEEVSRNICNIREVATENSDISKQMMKSSEELATLIVDLKSMLKAI
jgi:aerotaxis receptor